MACNPGFDMTGANVVTCGADGTWNGTIPSCNGKTNCCFFYYYLVLSGKKQRTRT